MRQRTNRDYAAGEFIAMLREDVGLSRRDFARRLQIDHPADPRMQVSERTLRRIEEEGAVPTTRVKYAIAAAFRLTPSQVWGARAVHVHRPTAMAA